jgi:putative DNA primase/helicase
MAVSKNSSTSKRKRKQLNVSNRELRALVPEAWELLTEFDSGERLFRFGNAVVRVDEDEKGNPIPSILDKEKLRYELFQAVDCVAFKKENNQWVSYPEIPPYSLINGMLATPQSKIELPVLEQITRTPQFDSKGNLVCKPGYWKPGGMLYKPPKGFKLPQVSLKPTGKDIQQAIAFIDDWLEGFPFVSEAEKTNFLSLPLEQFARGLIDGPLPIHAIEKPKEGTGSTLLVEMVSIVLSNSILPTTTAPENETNWKSLILSILMNGLPLTIIDNVKSLTSPTLASVVTVQMHQDKILHTNRMAAVPIRCSWVVTGNNPTYSNEIRRRIVRTRMDAKSSSPWIGRKFKHKESEWTKDNRTTLVRAFITLIQAWIAKGKPMAKSKDDPYIGKYEAWSQVIGGIFKACGIKGFLTNMDDFYSEAQTEDSEILPFVDAWWEQEKSNPVTAADLYESVYRSSDIILDLGTGDDKSRRVKLGKLLADLKDHQYPISPKLIVTVILDGVSHNARRYKLIEVSGEKGRVGEDQNKYPHEESENCIGGDLIN